MPLNPNSYPGRPPLQTCPDSRSTWTLAPSWNTWYDALTNRVFQTPFWFSDLHANRVNYPPGNDLSNNVTYPPNWTPNVEHGLYYETDRNVFYRSELVANTAEWVYFMGIMQGALASQPSDLGANDAGFLFFDTAAHQMYFWDGTAWHAFSALPAGPAGGDLGGTYPNPTVTGVNGAPVPASEIVLGTNSSGQMVAGQAVTSLSPGSLEGAVTLAAGANVTVTQAGQIITIASTGGTGGTANYWVNGALVGAEPTLNLIQGTNVTISGVHNTANHRVDVTITSSGTGGGGSQTPWLQNIDGGGYYLAHTGSLGIGGSFVAPPYLLNVSGASVVTSQVHISYDGALPPNDAGGYLCTAGGASLYITGGAAHSAGSLIAKAANWEFIDLVSGTFSVFLGTGATVGSAITLGPPVLCANGMNVGINTASPTYNLHLVNDSAAKPSTNTWTVASDIRLKENVRPFTEGLETLENIHPIRYRYNGKAGLPQSEGVGIDAGAHRDILPDCISTYKGKLDGEEEAELFAFNSHALTFMLINAVKELSERLEKLEKGG